MTHWIQLSAWPLLAAAAVVAVLWLTAALRKGPPGCPGPAVRWGWHPWRLLVRRDCGYDLRGLALVDGMVRCPECGTRQKPLARRRVGHVFRATVVCLLTIAGLACWKVAWIRYGRWAKYTPTPVLAALDYFPMPGRVESVMLERLESGPLWRWERDLLAALAIYHLGDDKRTRNAEWACDVLCYLDREAWPRLEAALDSPDYQRRQYAADLLQGRESMYRREEGPSPCPEPSDRLLAVSLEGLKNDRFEQCNAIASFSFLLRHRDRVIPMLPDTMRSGDRQQAFLGAILAGLMGAGELAPQAAPILVDHLRSNNSEGDARIAAPAMLGLGEAGRLYLLPAVDGDDPQARDLAWAIVKTLDHQPLGVRERDAIHNMTEQYTDLRAALSRRTELREWWGL